MHNSYWFKTDLQVHTPISRWEDFSFSNPPTEAEIATWAKKLIDEAKSKSVELLAITEHNDGSFIDQVLKASVGSGVTVLPGVEITTQEGVHLIAVFDNTRKIKSEGYDNWATFIRHLLTLVGVPGRTQENGQPSIASDNVPTVLEKVHKLGGISIFPHAFNHNGVIEDRGHASLLDWSTPQARSKWYQHKLCKIIQIPGEIDQLPQNKKDIVSGKNPAYGNKPVACITTSDTRSFSQLGTNNCWIKGHPTFEGLKQIMYVRQERVYIGSTSPAYLYPQINKIRFEGTENVDKHCLPTGLDIELSPNLNVLIGGRGTGKTTFLESLGFVFGENGGDEEPRSDGRISLISQTIDQLDEQGESGTVILGVQYGQNKSEFRRDLSYYKEPPVMGFGITYWSQGAIESHAYDAPKLRKLLEPMLSDNTTQDLEEKIRNSLLELKDLSTNFSRLTELKKLRKELQDKLAKHTSVLSTVQDVKFKALVESMRDLSGKKARVDTAIKGLQDYENELKENVISLKGLEDTRINWSELYKDYGVKDGIDPSATAKSIESNITAIRKSRENLEASTIYKKVCKDLKEKQAEYAEVARTLGLSLSKEQIEESSRQVATLTHGLEKLETQIKEIEGSVEDHEALVLQTKKDRDTLTSLRAAIFDTISEDLGEGVKIEDGEEYQEEDIANLFVKYAGRSNLRTKEMVSSLMDKLSFDSLIDHLENEKIPSELEGTLQGTLEWYFTSPEFDSRKLLTMKLKELQPVFTPVVSQDGKPLDELSFGERCALVLRIILGYGTEPLLIDQPEDHLDNDFIAKVLLDMLKEKKLVRQVILATHNPNIVVNADAENVVILSKENAHGEKCSVYQGGLEDKSVRDQVANILEGGETAFKKREERYEF